MAFRLLADDGSVHQFPDGTDTSVMSGVVSRYNTQLAQVTPQQPTALTPPNPQTFFDIIHRHGYGKKSVPYSKPLLGVLDSVNRRMPGENP